MEQDLPRLGVVDVSLSSGIFKEADVVRGDKELDETCVVCSRHFDDRYVQRTFKHVINGEVVEIDRERPALTDDAVPTIFPDAPSYLTKALPRNRKERSIADCETPSAKRMTPSKNDVASQDFGDEGVGDNAVPAPLHPFQQVMPPSALCSKTVLPNDPASLYFAWHTSTEPGDVRVLKHVIFSASPEADAQDEYAHVSKTYCRGMKVEECRVSTDDYASSALERAETFLLCPGCNIEPVIGNKCVRFGAQYFAKNCSVTTVDGKACLRCKYTRRLVQNQLNRLKKKRIKNFKQRMARKSLELFRARKKAGKRPQKH
ncbi:hypothetical protein MTO96_005714 [Rhipicephalus appendiculatus]